MVQIDRHGDLLKALRIRGWVVTFIQPSLSATATRLIVPLSAASQGLEHPSYDSSENFLVALNKKKERKEH